MDPTGSCHGRSIHDDHRHSFCAGCTCIYLGNTYVWVLLMALQWFPMYHGDYLRDTVDLSPSEHGIYLLMLMNFFQRGPLPDDLDRLCRIAANGQPQEVRGILERYWILTDAGWINGRMAEERAKSLELQEKRAESGRKGGQASAQARAQPIAKALASPNAQPNAQPIGQPNGQAKSKQTGKHSTTTSTIKKNLKAKKVLPTKIDPNFQPPQAAIDLAHKSGYDDSDIAFAVREFVAYWTTTEQKRSNWALTYVRNGTVKSNMAKHKAKRTAAPQAGQYQRAPHTRAPSNGDLSRFARPGESMDEAVRRWQREHAR